MEKIMSKILNFAILATVAALTLPVVTPAANAGGFLADTFIRPFNPGLADLADGVHKGLGNPLDQLNPIRPGGGFASAQGPAPGPVMGNRCATPVGAYWGPFNPVGMACGANTPYGFF